ncbi:MAG TPA: biotin/lipoyl-containing protein, partial [Sphingomonas sp.]
ESFYFLEMNTRLQVEHPVTEEITGLDLVEQMIRVAAGEKLAFAQDDLTINGWAIETRVYAEDPYRGFLPSIGRLVRYNPPQASPSRLREGLGEGVSRGASSNDTSPPPTPPASRRGEEPIIRVDDGVAEGGEVSMFYDPMIAKLITWAPTRDEAADAQVAALDAFEIEGPGHNIDFLSALVQHPRFRSGNLTTGFIAEEYPDGFTGAPASPELLRLLAAIAAFAATAQADRARRIDGQLGRTLLPPGDWQVTIDGADHDVSVSTDGLVVDGEDLPLAMEYTPGDRMIEVDLLGDDEDADGERETVSTLSVRIAPVRSGFRLTARGASHVARVIPARVAPYAKHMIEKIPPDLSKFLLCPMPGLLVRIDVAAGDKVEPGQPLAVVEAMKMENILRAEKAGTVKAVGAKAGDSLAVDAVILELE